MFCSNWQEEGGLLAVTMLIILLPMLHQNAIAQCDNVTLNSLQVKYYYCTAGLPGNRDPPSHFFVNSCYGDHSPDAWVVEFNVMDCLMFANLIESHLVTAIKKEIHSGET